MDPHRARSSPTVRPSVAGEEFVAGDDALLDGPAGTVRVASLRVRCLSYGVGVPSTAPYVSRATAEGIPTVPRRSGGTGLLHEPGDLAWSVVVDRGDSRLAGGFTTAYTRLGRGVVRWLADRGLDAAWRPAPGIAPAYCTLSGRGWVLEADGAIVGGAAQHAARGRLLHHGTISRRVDRATIDRLFGLPTPGPTARLGELGALGAADEGLLRELAGAIGRDLAST